MLNLPNILTIARILLLPFMFVCFLNETPTATWICFGLYVVAALTDFFDGWAARKFNQISAFGTFLDPISDKIFVGCLLIMLVGFDRLEGVWIIPAMIILFREFLISGLREFLGPHDVKLPVTQLAKWKTTVQMLALALLILAPLMPICAMTGEYMLAFAAILTLITGWGYVRASWPHLKG